MFVKEFFGVTKDILLGIHNSSIEQINSYKKFASDNSVQIDYLKGMSDSLKAQVALQEKQIAKAELNAFDENNKDTKDTTNKKSTTTLQSKNDKTLNHSRYRPAQWRW